MYRISIGRNDESHYLHVTLDIDLISIGMQASETVRSWNHRYKRDENSPPSPMSDLSSRKGAIDNTPYLTCTERLACEAEMSSKATFYCAQCNSLQCILCEKQIHENSDSIKHERLNLDEMDDEYCSVDRQHQAVFYCPTCALYILLFML